MYNNPLGKIALNQTSAKFLNEITLYVVGVNHNIVFYDKRELIVSTKTR
jgi:hypothetical protein